MGRLIMTTICFIRHGQTDWNVEGRMQGQQQVPLNNTGREQAFACTAQLKKHPWHQLISSPLLRAVETAQIFSEQLGLPVQIVQEFTEKGYGEAEGLRKHEISSRFASGPIPDEECPQALQQRVLHGITEICSRFPNQQLIVVTHGDIIAFIVDYYFDQKNIPDNASLTPIRFTHEGAQLLSISQLL